MMQRRQVLGSAAALLAGGPARSQGAFPSRPIELLVSFNPGGGTDALARALAEALRKHLPQPVSVLNRPGASGSIGMAEVAAAPPDGHKLILLTVEATILPHLGIGKVSHEDFAPIMRLNFDPSAITVRSDAPWNTLEEFLDAARKRPGQVMVGNAGPGSIWHVAATALEAQTGIKVNHIPFQGAAPAVLALMGGHVEAVTVSPAEVSQHVQAGKLRTLAVMAEQRVKGFEKVPTLKERGIDIAMGAWRGVAAPKATPPAVIATLADAVLKATQESGYRETLDRLNLGPAPADAATFRAAMDRDSKSFKTLLAKIDLKS